jgi:hypothetical protein
LHEDSILKLIQQHAESRQGGKEAH